MTTDTQTPVDISADVADLQRVEAEMNDVLVEKQTAVRLMILSTLAQTHLLDLGERGIAKTMTADLWHGHIDPAAEKFYVLMSKALPPELLVGNLSIKALVERDVLSYRIAGHMPTAHIAILDECFKANAVVLNMLLGIINERRFKANGQVHQCPLWTVVGTSNVDEYNITGELEPFRDRFAAALYEKPVQSDDGFMKILRGQSERFTGNVALPPPSTVLGMDQIERLQIAARQVRHPDDVFRGIITLRKRAESEGLRPSARRYGELMKLMAAQAVFNGRSESRVEDLALAQHVLWTDLEDAAKAYEVCIDYGGATQKAANKLRQALDPVLQTILDLRSQASADGTLPRDRYADAADANSSLRKILEQIEKHVEDAKTAGDDTGELDQLARDVADAQHEVRKFLGMA